jgi:hypothetical protein
MKHSPKTHVLKAWSEMGFGGSYWLMSALASSMNYVLMGHNLMGYWEVMET